MLERYQEEIDDLSNLLKSVKGRSINICLVAGLNTPIPHGDPSAFKIRNFSLDMLEEILNGFQTLGFRAELFGSADIFIRSILEADKKKSNCLDVVYDVEEAGSGAGRRALISAFCNRHQIICINSDAHGCSIGRHKYHSSILLNHFDLPSPETWMFKYGEHWVNQRTPPEGLKVILKAPYESSSVGINENSIFHVDENLDSIVREFSERIKQDVVAQRFISGSECAVPILEGTKKKLVTPIVELEMRQSSQESIITANDVMGAKTFTNKVGIYSSQITTRFSQITTDAFEILGFRGIGRFDYRIDKKGNPWLIDVGATPVLTPSGSFVFSLKTLGFSYSEILGIVVASTLCKEGIL